MDTASLSQLSNHLMNSAIGVYALALLAHAAHVAIRTRHATSPATAHAALAHLPVLVGGPTRARPAPDAPALDADTETPHRPGRGARIGNIAVSLTGLGFLLHLGAITARGLAAGRAPWGNMYEFAATGALAAVAVFLVMLRRAPVRDLGPWIVAVVLLILGLAVTVLYTPVGPLVPALNSYWLLIHVAAAIVSGGVFTVGAVATALYLVRSRWERPPGPPSTAGYARLLPPSATLDRVAHTCHTFAFPIWTFAVIAGAIWAENAWGRYWGWDPKETWAFITWVIYAAYLHARATTGWRGRMAAWLALTGYLAFLFNFFGVNMWITGLHSYAGI